MRLHLDFFIESIHRLTTGIRLTAFVIACGLVSPNIIAEEFDSNEIKLKMLYLYNFSKLTQWPKDKQSSSDEEFNICIYGDHQYIAAAKSLRKKTIKKQPIKILPITTTEQIIVCHTLFISQNSPANKKFIKQASRHSVLTVSDDNMFINNGGIIKLITINNKIRFEINIVQMNNVSLEISSKLLRLAKVIHRNKIVD